MSFGNPIVGGVTLVRPAIQSPNFITTVSGWSINKDGTVEFNDAVIRGSLSAGGGVVLLNSNGLAVQSIGGDAIYEINRVGGFMASNVPEDGTRSQITPGAMFLTPEDPSPLGVAVDFATWNVQYDNSGAANETPIVLFQGVEYTGKSAPAIEMWGQRADDSNPDNTSAVHVYADDIHFHVGTTQPSYQRGEYGALTLSFTAVASATVAVTYGKTYTTAPYVDVNIDSGSGVTARWCARAISRSTTGFTFFVFSADAIANTWSNIPLSWTATEQH